MSILWSKRELCLNTQKKLGKGASLPNLFITDLFVLSWAFSFYLGSKEDLLYPRTRYIWKVYILIPCITKNFLTQKMREIQMKFSLMKSILRTSKKENSEIINAIHVNIRSL